MKGLGTIIKKEFQRFFKDRKLVVSIILPGILIYIIYTLMGTFLFSEEKESYTYCYAVVNPSAQVQPIADSYLSTMLGDVVYDEVTDVEAAKEGLLDQTYDLVVVYPSDFDERIEAFEPGTGQIAPMVAVYYNSEHTQSANFYSVYLSALEYFEDSIANKFDVNTGDDQYDVMGDASSAQAIMTQVLSGLLPYLVLTFVFSGAMSVTPESIAGEKERGTIATMLVTPVRRSTIALGKIISLSCFSSLGAISSFLGVMLSLPKLMGGIELSITVGQWLMLLLVLVTFVPLVVGLIAMVSAYAKSVKEATSYTGVLMIVVMIVGLSAMLGFTPSLWMSFIPLFNVVTALSSILTGALTMPMLLCTVLANVVYIGLVVFAMAKMFNSEKIMNN